MPEWIDVKNSYPPLNSMDEFIFFTGKKEIVFGKAFDIDDAGFLWISDSLNQKNEIATHWMKIPEPPK